MKICKQCNKELVRKVWYGKRKRIETNKRFNERQFCDNNCRIAYNKTLSKEYWQKQSPICNKGHKPWNKGKRGTYKIKQTSGYIKVFYPDGSWEYEHRIVAREKYGDISGLCIHHVDRDKSNNKPENILALTQSEHMKLHWSELR